MWFWLIESVCHFFFFFTTDLSKQPVDNPAKPPNVKYSISARYITKANLFKFLSDKGILLRL